MFWLQVSKCTIYLEVFTQLNPLVCFHRIYQDSTFLRLLRYFLQNMISRSSHHPKERGVSVSLRKSCLGYILSVWVFIPSISKKPSYDGFLAS
ncbi:RofA family transcriptional regulator [Streptococcus intermedius JTH08]|nr:RofA family transcriptional regulator [Streptococcus intermedius JTH08]